MFGFFDDTIQPDGRVDIDEHMVALEEEIASDDRAPGRGVETRRAVAAVREGAGADR